MQPLSTARHAPRTARSLKCLQQLQIACSMVKRDSRTAGEYSGPNLVSRPTTVRTSAAIDGVSRERQPEWEADPWQAKGRASA